MMMLIAGQLQCCVCLRRLTDVQAGCEADVLCLLTDVCDIVQGRALQSIGR